MGTRMRERLKRCGVPALLAMTLACGGATPASGGPAAASGQPMPGSGAASPGPVLARWVTVAHPVHGYVTRLVSEERRAQTLSLLFSAPLSMSEIVLGKFLGVMGFLTIMVLMIVLMPLSLLSGGSLDLGMLFSGVLGLLLLLASFAALGLFMSTLTEQPTIAAVSSFGVLLLLWIIDWAGGNESAGQASELFAYLSLLRHFESLLKGVFDSADLIYYLLFVTLFLVLSIRRLDADRLQH